MQFQNNSINTYSIFARVGAEDIKLNIQSKGSANKEINYSMVNTKIEGCNKYHTSYVKILNLKILVYNKPEKYLKMSHLLLIIFTWFLQTSNKTFFNKANHSFPIDHCKFHQQSVFLLTIIKANKSGKKTKSALTP